jgi:hypothetical protein
VVIFFLFLYFSPPDKGTFSMKKNDDGKIEIYGLEEKDIDKMD